MKENDIKIITAFPRRVREIENTFIPLAEGIRLAARIWLPEDAETDPVPAILEFLPYRKRDGTSERDALSHPYYAGHGYACVRVDMRGAGDSEGILEDEYLKTEQDDALEVLDWITKQPWCTGATGIVGISWGGFNGLQIAARRPPSLKAIVTIASTDDRYADDIHYMGGVMLNDTMSWGATMFAFNSRPPDPAIVGDTWRDLWMARLEANDPWSMKWLSHQTRDAFWQHGSVCEDYADIECAVYAVGGWADGYSNAVPRMLEGLSCPKKGLVGPWAHKYPHFGLPGPRIGFLQETLRWWDHWLKDIDTGIMDEPQYRAWMQDSAVPASYYEVRQGRWVAEPTWPSDHSNWQKLYFTERGLRAEAGSEEIDVAIHTPHAMGTRQGEWCAFGLDPDLPGDQREEDGCSVVFETKPLTEAVEILGAPRLRLLLSADQLNAFIVARLNDVAADGASTRVTYGVLNLTHRDSHEYPEPLVPGDTYDIQLQLNDIAQVFPVGHRIRIALSNTMWPQFWPSPQPVALTLKIRSSHLELPVRAPRKTDEALSHFGPAESAPAQSAKVLAPSSYVRQVERDDVLAETRLTAIADTGMLRLTDLSWEHGSVSRQYCSIRDDDPTSARLDLHWTMRFRRPDADFDVRTETRSGLTSTPTQFHFTAEMEVFEHEEKTYSRVWTKTVDRELN